MYKFSKKVISSLIIGASLLFSPISNANEQNENSPKVENKSEVKKTQNNEENNKENKKNKKNKKDKKSKKEFTGVVNINTATVQELKALPGIGKGISKQIVEMRAKEKFKSIDDLKKIKGLGPKTIEKIKNNLSF